MPRFNADKLGTLVSELRKATDRLNNLKALGRETFLGDPDKIGSAKYHLVLAIEAAIDISNHLISQNGYRVPVDYADAFKVLHEEGAFNRRFTNELINMAKFRNRLVHIYWEVDDGKVFEIIETRTADFKEFLDELAKFLKLERL